MKLQSLNFKTIAFCWRHAWQHRQFLIPLLICVPTAVVLLDFIMLYIAATVLGRISQGDFDPSNLWASFGRDMIMYAIVTLSSAVALWRLNIWLVWNLELRVLRDIAQEVFEHVLSLGANFHANNFGGSLVSQTNKLTGAYIRLADSTIFNLYTLVISLATTLIILAPRVPLYAGVLSVLSVVYILGTIRFSRKVREANTKEATAQSQQTGNLADSITNVMAVKSFAGLAHEKHRFAKATNHTRQMGLGSMRATMIRESYSSLMTSSIGISSLVISVIALYAFHTDITTLFLIATYTGAIGHRLWEFQNVLRQYNRALGDASDMMAILQLEPEVQDPAKPEKPRIKNGEIKFELVEFAHDESKGPLFQNLNLHIKPGEKIGLVGHSGGGKTTLTKVLLRFADISTGSIKIDGQDISHITQDDLRRHIAYVPQEPLLFHRSLAENIAYGQPGAPQSKIEKVAKLAHAHEFIGELPQKYETLVGERGIKLSGGQKQRVAIARAMLKDAPILVLDEATSALDSESEVLIQDALWKLMEGRTAIVIAHRLSTIQRMDRIIVMDNGQIAEEGTHKELIKRKGIYANLWAHQSGGFLED